MNNKLKFFSAAILINTRNEGVLKLVSTTCLAYNELEAEGYIISYARKTYPIEQGFYNYSVVVSEIDNLTLEKLIENRI